MPTALFVRTGMTSTTGVVVPTAFRIAQLGVLITASGVVAIAADISTGATHALLVVLTIVACAALSPGWLVAGGVGAWTWCILLIHTWVTTDTSLRPGTVALGVLSLTAQVTLSVLAGEPRLRRAAGSIPHQLRRQNPLRKAGSRQ